MARLSIPKRRRGHKAAGKKCPGPRVNPRTGRRTVYLGHRVKDVKGPGLDSASEYRAIMRSIMRDYRSGCISKRTAMGRLLLLYRLTYPKRNSKAAKLSPRTREKLRREIKELMRKLR